MCKCVCTYVCVCICVSGCSQSEEVPKRREQGTGFDRRRSKRAPGRRGVDGSVVRLEKEGVRVGR